MEPREFGPYRIEATLDRPGPGEVYRAVDTEHDREVALTVLPEALTTDAAYRARFAHEAGLAATLDEPHVVPVRRHGEVEGRLFLESPLVPGRDLAAVLAEDGPMDPARAVAVVSRAARALDAAHAAGLVHGDVRSGAVLVAADDAVQLTGLGIPRPGSDAPGDPVDRRADVRALAAVLAECLTGRPDAPTAAPSADRPAPTEALQDVVRRGLAEDDEGFATCGALADAARAALGDPAPAPPEQELAGATRLDAGSPPAAGRRWAGPLPLVLAGVAVVVALAVVLALVLTGGSDEDQAGAGPATTPLGTTTRSAPPEDEAEDRLRAIIPGEFVNVDCDTGEPADDGALAVLGCGSSSGQPGPEDSVFYLYEDAATADDVFLADMERNDVAPLPPGTACPRAQGHGTYEDDGRAGRLACYIDADNDAILAWTQDDVGAEGWVVIIDGGQPGLDALYEWWAFPETETSAFLPR